MYQLQSIDMQENIIHMKKLIFFTALLLIYWINVENR